MRNKITTLILAIILIAAAGCGKADPVTLTEADNGSTITLAQGETLAVSLESNPSTGYSWEVIAPDVQFLEQVGESEFKSDALPGMVGAGGTQVLTFKALAPGTTVLTLGYHRPWETDVAPIQTFTVTVIVE